MKRVELHRNQSLARKSGIRRKQAARRKAALASNEKQRNDKLANPERIRKSGISPASRDQRAKVRDASCVVSGHDRRSARIEPMHLCSRAQGGCDDPLCVVPGAADVHRLFDQGRLDLLPHLLADGYVAEIQHALGHYDGDLLSLLHRLTGERYVPARERAA